MASKSTKSPTSSDTMSPVTARGHDGFASGVKHSVISRLQRFVNLTLRVLLAISWGGVFIYLCIITLNLWRLYQVAPTSLRDVNQLLMALLLGGLHLHLNSVVWIYAGMLIFLVFLVACMWATIDIVSQPVSRNEISLGDGPRVLSDVWFDKSDDKTPDPLEYEEVARNLTEIIVRSAVNAPFTVGLEARWGLGKTTIMRMVEKQLRTRNQYFKVGQARWKCVTVWFDPWRHRKRDAQKAFMSAVFADVPWWVLNWWISPVIRPRLASQAANIFSFIRQRNGNGGTAIANRLDVNANYRNRFQDDFSKMLEYWAGAERGTQILMVIFIDDLDRCSPTDVVQILEAMKLFLESHHCAFVLGLDRDVVAQSIEYEYGPIKIDGLEYLQKFIQVELPLRQPSDEALKELVTASEGDAGLKPVFDVIAQKEQNYQTAILKYTRRTPRQIKRLLNGLAVSAPNNLPQDFWIAFVLLLLQVRFPAFYRLIERMAQQYRLPGFLSAVYAALHPEHPGESELGKYLNREELTELDELLGNQEFREFLDMYALYDHVDEISRVMAAGLAVVTPGDSGVGDSGAGSPSEKPEQPNASEGSTFDDSLLSAPERLIGREAELQRVLSQLREHKFAAIIGLGGIGKTALAMTAARQLHREGRFADGIVVVHCGGLNDYKDVLLQALSAVSPDRRSPEWSETLTLPELAHEILGGKDILIVLDDVGPDLDVEPLMPLLLAAGTTVLVTARQELPPIVAPQVASHTLGPLSPAAAEDLLVYAYGASDTQDFTLTDRKAIQRIVVALGYHTLAIRLAGAYAAGAHRSLTALADELESDPLGLPRGDIPRAPALILNRSIGPLPADARRLLVSLIAFATPEFGRNAVVALAQTLNLSRPNDLIDLLIRRALVDATVNSALPEEGDRERLRLHPLVRAYLSEQFANWTEIERDSAFEAVAAYYADFTSKASYDALAPEEHNVAGAIEWAIAHQLDALVVALCSNTQDYWRDRSRTEANLRFLPIAISAMERSARQTSGQLDRERMARLELTYGLTLLLVGEVDKAEAIFKRNLQLRDALGDKRGEGVVLTYLGQIAYQRGRLAEAENYFQKSLSISSMIKNRHGEGEVLSNLGRIVYQRGRLDEAADYFQQALAIRREVSDRRGEGVDLNNLGSVAQARGRLDEAAAYYQQSLAIRREVQDRRGEGVDLFSLGSVAQARGRLNEAAAYYQQSLAIDHEVQDRRGEGIVLSRLGQVAQARGRLDEAVAYYQQALAIRREVGDRRGEGVVLSNLGQVAQARGRLDEAVAYYQQALAIDREVGDRQGEGVVLANLGQVVQARGRLDEAVAYYQHSLAIRREVGDRQGEGVVLAQLGLIAAARQSWNEAEDAYRKGLALMEQTQDAPNEATIALDLGQLLVEQRGQPEEGCALLQRAYAIRRDLNLPGIDEAEAALQSYGCTPNA